MATLQTTPDKPSRRAWWLRRFGIGLGIFLLLLLAVGIAARIWLRHAMYDALPQIDGTAQAHGLAQTVRVTRDNHGTPHITAHSLHDLAFAQGYVTAQDRLWQMDVLRRHASGQLAELLGSNLLPHDELQRTLALRAAAERALPALPADQRALLEAYASGVNAFVDAHGSTLPAEFRVLRYQPAPWTDDQGHIGYHMVGRVPVRGDAAHPAGLSPVPVHTGSYEWSGHLPFEDLPQSYDPPGGILATANARITPDDYKHHITLDWEAPYRNERIWKQLAARPKLTQQDMLALENDVYPDFDHVLAKHLVYAIDHAGNSNKTTVQAADILRKWDGVVAVSGVAPNIVNATKSALWIMLLQPKLGSAAGLHTWRSRTFVLEDLVQHQPARWLPQEYPSWNELLTAAVERGLHDADAPRDLSTWTWEKTNAVQLSHPIFGMTPAPRRVIGMNTSSQSYSIPGDGGTTVRPGLKTHGASERFVIDPTDPEHAWMNIVSGESGNPASPWYLDPFEMWVHGTTMLLPFSNTQAAHTLVLTP